MPTKKKIQKKIKPTIEDKVLNDTKEEVITKEVFDVFNKKAGYKVYNLVLNNKPSYMAGTMVEQFFGSKDREAKEQLMTGAKSVILYEKDKFTKEGEKIPLYKIEVMD